MDPTPLEPSIPFQRSKSTVELNILDQPEKKLHSKNAHKKQISYSGETKEQKKILVSSSPLSDSRSNLLKKNNSINNLNNNNNENNNNNDENNNNNENQNNESSRNSLSEHPLKFHHRRATSLASSEVFSNKYSQKDYEPSEASNGSRNISVENHLFKRWLRRGSDGSLELSPKSQRKLIKFFMYILMTIFIGILAVFSINWTFAFCVLPLSTFRECRVTSLDGGPQTLCSSSERTPTLKVEWCKNHHDLKTCSLLNDQTCSGFVNVFSSPKSLKLYESFECTVNENCHTIPTHLDHVNPSPNWYYFSFFLVVFITCAFCFCLSAEFVIVLAYVCLSRKDYTIRYLRDDQQVI